MTLPLPRQHELAGHPVPLPLLARERELAQVSELLSRARAGTGSALTVIGGRGLGKTRFLSEVASHSRQLIVFRLTGLPAEAHSAYAGLERMLRSSPLAGRSEGRALLGRLPDLDGRADPTGLARDLLALLEPVSPSRSFLMAVDDAHLLDPATRAVLGALGRRLSASRLVLAVTLVPSADSAEWAGFRAIHLGRLAPGAIVELVTAQVDSCAPEVALSLARWSGGNPSAALEALALLSADQLAGVAPLPAPVPAGPRTQEANAEAWGALPPPTRRALLVIAALGGAGPVEPAFVAAGCSKEDLGPAIEAGLVSPAGSEITVVDPVLLSSGWALSPARSRAAVRSAVTELQACGRGRTEAGRRTGRASKAPVYEIQLLGDFRVTSGGRDVTPKQAQVAQALKLLALRGKLSTDELAELLWPDTDLQRGRVRLRNVLSRLRGACPGLVGRDGDVVRLTSGARVDVVRFERDAVSALEAVESGDRGSLELATAAFGLYGGDLLPADRFEDWTASDRQRTEALYRELLDVLVAERVAEGNTREALRLLEEGIARRPYDDELYAEAAALLQQRGWRSRAMQVLGQGRAAAARLGVDPSPSILQLEAELRSAGAADPLVS